MATWVRRGYFAPGRQRAEPGTGPIEMDCESQATSETKAGFRSGGTVPPQVVVVVCKVGGELVGLPPPASVLPTKQFDGPGSRFASAKSALVGLPKNPLLLKVLPVSARPDSS